MVRSGRHLPSVSNLATFIWVALGILMVVLLLQPVSPRQSFGLRSFTTPEITASHFFSQTFTMRVDGLESVALRPVLTGRPEGVVVLALVDVTDSERGEQVRTESVPANLLAGAPWYFFDFVPVTNSKWRNYRLDILSHDARTGVALRAVKGAGYRGGTLEVNGIVRWADLRFAAETPFDSRWSALWFRTSPGGFPSGRITLGALGLMWITLGPLLRYAARPDAR